MIDLALYLIHILLFGRDMYKEGVGHGIVHPSVVHLLAVLHFLIQVGVTVSCYSLQAVFFPAGLRVLPAGNLKKATGNIG